MLTNHRADPGGGGGGCKRPDDAGSSSKIKSDQANRRADLFSETPHYAISNGSLNHGSNNNNSRSSKQFQCQRPGPRTLVRNRSRGTQFGQIHTMRPLVLAFIVMAVTLLSILVFAQRSYKTTDEIIHKFDTNELVSVPESVNNPMPEAWYEEIIRPLVGYVRSTTEARRRANNNQDPSNDSLDESQLPQNTKKGFLNYRKAALKNIEAAEAERDKQHAASSAAAELATKEDLPLITSTDQLNYVTPIDKIKGIDLGQARMSEWIAANQARFNTQSHRRVKCLVNKHDRIIAQKIALNDISRPIINSDGRFDNPFPTWTKPSMADALWFMVLESDESNVPKTQEELVKELPMLEPVFKVNDPRRQDFRVTWIGHSTLLIQVDGYNILTDPIFSERASPSQYFGPKRIREPPCNISALPKIDVVLVSHNHYDHLDADTVKEINDKFGKECRWLIPLGLGDFMRSMSVENYVELDWWQKDCFHVASKPVTTSHVVSRSSASLDTTNNNAQQQHNQTMPNRSISSSSSSSSSSSGTDGHPTGQSHPPSTSRATRTNRVELDIYFTPTQHWSRRGMNDINRSLWGSFVIVNSNGATFFFAGDTGYCSVFKEIGKVFGPFSGAAIPIGAYKPRWFLKPSHVDPFEAVQIHRDLRSLRSIAIHHSTFILSNENYKEPARFLNEIMDSLRANESFNQPFTVVKHGETVEFCKNNSC